MSFCTETIQILFPPLNQGWPHACSDQQAAEETLSQFWAKPKEALHISAYHPGILSTYQVKKTQASCWKMTGSMVQKANGQPTPDVCMKTYLIHRLARWPQTHERAQLNQKNHPTEPSPNSWLIAPRAGQMVLVLNYQVLTLFFTQHWIIGVGSNIDLIYLNFLYLL